MRNNFEKIKTEAEELAKTWKIERKLQEKRSRITKRFHDELSVDTQFADPLHKFKGNIYYASLDIMISQLEVRFKSLNEINEYFSFLSPEALISFTDNQLVSAATRLCEKYDEDLSMAITTEIISFKNIVANDLKKRKMYKISQTNM